jgi:hypothetical protein
MSLYTHKFFFYFVSVVYIQLELPQKQMILNRLKSIHRIYIFILEFFILSEPKKITSNSYNNKK